MVSVRTGAAAWMVAALACADPGDAGDSVAESSSGPAGLDCVAPTEPDLTIVMEPEGLGWPQMYLLDAPCTVASVDDESNTLALSCMTDSGPLDWSLRADGLLGTWPTALIEDAPVQLDYYASRTSGFGTYPTHWAVVRIAGETDPVLVASATDGAIPDTDGTPAIDVVDETTCETADGSCGFGEMGRDAIRFSLSGVGETIVFDHGASQLGDYAIQVADVITDTGNCEGETMTWYEFVVLRVELDGADG
jgi:hypothetical protein